MSPKAHEARLWTVCAWLLLVVSVVQHVEVGHETVVRNKFMGKIYDSVRCKFLTEHASCCHLGSLIGRRF